MGTVLPTLVVLPIKETLRCSPFLSPTYCRLTLASNEDFVVLLGSMKLVIVSTYPSDLYSHGALGTPLRRCLLSTVLLHSTSHSLPQSPVLLLPSPAIQIFEYSVYPS